MPRPPDILNLLAWVAALWLAGAAVMLGLVFWHTSVRYHWTTDVYLAATVLFSLLSFGAMCVDKYKAGTGGRRVPEVVLHTFELLGGWPGSLLGQRTFRHKTRKLTYQGVFWAIVAIHLVLMAWTAYLWWNPPAAGTREPTSLPVIEPGTNSACPRGRRFPCA